MFIAPGLYKHEKRAFLPFLIATPILFFIGGAFVYYLVFPVAWPFFASFEQQGAEGTMAIALEPKVNEYLSLVMRLIFAFGLSFELPVVMTLLARARDHDERRNAEEAPICDPPCICRGSDPDTARPAQSDWARTADYPALRDIDLLCDLD